MTRLNRMASVFVISGYLFFIGVIGYEANIGPSLEETPRVPLLFRHQKESDH